jgi:N utilization substance protein B
MGRRTKARECALQILYQLEVRGVAPDTAIAAFWQLRTASPEAKAMAERLVRGASSHRERIDAAIARQATRWRMDRIATVERNILRIGVYELMEEPETPPAVVIDEAVEMAKRFGEAESHAFVNGVLDGIRRSLSAAPGEDGPGDEDGGGR